MGIGLNEETRELTFTSSDETKPTLRHNLEAFLIKDGKLVCAVWQAETVPYAGKELAYYLYEDSVEHHSRSEYIYWHHSGLAGCILKPMLRTRLGYGKHTADDLVMQMFSENTSNK